MMMSEERVREFRRRLLELELKYRREGDWVSASMVQMRIQMLEMVLLER